MSLLLSLVALVFAVPMKGDSITRPKVAVVLSGGGAKGLAHIGVLKVVERAGIPVDIVTGTSMGSIVGGLYSCGWNASQLDSLVRRQDWPFLLSDRGDYYSQTLEERRSQSTYFLSKTFSIVNKHWTGVGGLIEGRNLLRLFNHLTAGYADSMDFNRLPKAFACVATNIVDNTEYDFHSGVLAEAMRASMSIPGVFTPVRKDSMVLVDGGLRNNYPADLARQMGATYVIGSTVQGPPKTADELAGGSAVLGQIVDVNCKHKYDDNLAITDVAVRVNTKGYSAASFTPAAIDTLIRRGEEEAMRHWNELMALKEKLGLTDDTLPLLHPDSAALLPMQWATVKSDRLPSHDLVVGSVGARFDTEEKAAVQLQGGWRSSHRPLRLEATVRLGRNSRGVVYAGWKMPHGTEAGMAYMLDYRDLDVYHHGAKDYSATFTHYQARLSLMNINVRNLFVDVAARWDYYNYHSVLFARADGGGEVPSDDHYFSYHASLHYDSENTALFATRGARFMAEYAYFTDNFAGYNHHRGFSEVSALWRYNFRLSGRLVLQPMFYGRMLFGKEIPAVRRNYVGGSWFGHYVEQQMPFAAMHHFEMADNEWVACQAQLQAQLTTNNFVLFRAAAAQHADDADALFRHAPTLGFQAAYFYRTVVGPVGLTAGWNNCQDGVSVLASLGFDF